MKKNARHKNIFLFRGFDFAIFSLFLCSCSGEVITKFDDLDIIEGYQNVILMIGDGMGENHLKVTEAYNEQPTFIRQAAKIRGWAETYSLTASITDSAAAATAMSTGLKVPNGNIAYKSGQKLTTMSEFSKAYGKGVGLVATEALYGATPAAFSAHNRSRQNSEEIALEQYKSKIDLFIGAGKSFYDDQVALLRDNNLSYYSNFDNLTTDVNEIISGNTRPFTRFLASFSSISTSVTSSSSPTLKDASLNAIRYLDKAYEDKGFFLVIEGSHIDKRAHDHDLYGVIEQVSAFDRAVSDVVEWSQQDGETFVMVTADHETGGLLYQNETKEELKDELFSKNGHSGVDVPFYIYNSNNLSFINEGETIDNTDIAKIFRALIRNS